MNDAASASDVRTRNERAPMNRFARILPLALLAALVLPAAAKTISVPGETGPTTSSAQRTYDWPLSHGDVVPESLTVFLDGAAAFRDRQGDGTLAASGGSGSGTRQYATGRIRLSFNGSVPSGGVLSASYEYAEDDSPLPVFRFYSKNYKGHFFTISGEEKDDLVAHNPNWKYEGVAYRAFPEEADGTVALHRFYSKGYRGHFFTIDEEESWTIRLTNPNWKYEGVAYHVYPGEVEGSVRVHRFWSKGYRHHFYTTDEEEMWTIRLTNPNWKYEGVAFWALPAPASGTADWEYEVNGDGRTCTVTGAPGASGDLAIPSTIDGYRVTAIGEEAFEDNTLVTSVTIPEGVTDIGDYAFAGCEGLSSVSLPSTLKTIGEGAFQYCDSLSSISLPNGLESIGGSAFWECVLVTSVSIPASVTAIGGGAFADCSSLRSISVASGNQNFKSVSGALFSKDGTFLLQVPGGLTGSYAVPAGTTYCDYYALFCDESKITSVSFPASFEGRGYWREAWTEPIWDWDDDEGQSVLVDVVEHPAGYGRSGGGALPTLPEALSSISVASGNAFYSSADGVLFDKQKTRLILYPRARTATSYTVPSTVKTIANGAIYWDVPALRTLVIPSNVTNLEGWAVSGCSGLSSVTIGSGVRAIGERNFADCPSLATISIPASVEFVGSGSFTGCDALSSISVASGNARYKSVDGALLSKDGTLLLAVPGAGAGSYSVPSGVVRADHGAFRCCSVSSVALPASFRGFGSESRRFDQEWDEDVLALVETRTWSEAWTNPFGSCPNLLSVSVAAGNPEFKAENGSLLSADGTWLWCVPPATAGAYSIPSGVKYVCRYAFSADDPALTSVSIPASVEGFGNRYREFEGYAHRGFDDRYWDDDLDDWVEYDEPVVVEDRFDEDENSSPFEDSFRVSSFSVASGNARFSAMDEVLFNADKTLLVAYPAAKPGSSYTVPASVSSFLEGSFWAAFRSSLRTLSVSAEQFESLRMCYELPNPAMGVTVIVE